MKSNLYRIGPAEAKITDYYTEWRCGRYDPNSRVKALLLAWEEVLKVTVHGCDIMAAADHFDALLEILT